MKYLMESVREASRLDAKTDYEETKKQLLDCGLDQLNGVPHIVDAGCGSGAVSEIIAEISSQAYGHCKLSLLDLSPSRLKEAGGKLAPYSDQIDLHLVNCELEQIPDHVRDADLLFSRFVFEYLKEPATVFRQYMRILRPGGKLVLADLDHNMMNHYPIKPLLQERLEKLMSVFQEMKLFDPYAGRKLYQLFYTHSFREIQVRLYPHHIFYGGITNRDSKNWVAKFQQVLELYERGEFDIDFDLYQFVEEFRSFLSSEVSFSYTPLILVEGLCPENPQGIRPSEPV